MLTRLSRLVEVLGVNALPLGGVLAGAWSQATALSLYWWENLAAGLFIAVRLWLHQRWHPDVPRPTNRLQQPGQFFVTTLAFTIAHGVFLAVLFTTVLQTRPDAGTLRAAALPLVALQAVALGADLWTLHAWPQAQVLAQADHMLGRVVLVHLSLPLGMLLFAAADREWAFFACFATLKGLSDLAQVLVRPWARAASAAPGPPAARRR
ncbi:MAG: DUF6498-containing protein [Vicinamibacterales bacterium]